MSCFTRFDYIFMSLRDFLKRSLWKGLLAHLLRRTISYLRNKPSGLDTSGILDPHPQRGKHGYQELENRVHNLLNQGASREEVDDAITKLRVFSCNPIAREVAAGTWQHVPSEHLIAQTHLYSTFEDAVTNIEATGRSLSLSDEKYLRLLLTHHCGWSATYPERLNDPWVKFFHESYPQLKGLVPILDSMTYVEELIDLPDGFEPSRPEFFLLATSDSYYVYNFEEMGGCYGLLCAGNSLEGVYTGMNEGKWAGWNDDDWEVEEAAHYSNPEKYFHSYYRKRNGLFGIVGVDK